MIPIKQILIGSVFLGMLVVRSAFGGPPETEEKTAVDAGKTAAPTQSVDASTSPKPDSQSSNPKPDDSPSEYALTKELLGNLSPENMQSLGEMLEEDWQDRPEWGEMAVAILKNDFMRPGSGWWKPSAKRFDWNWLSEHFDANNDGNVGREEFPSDVTRADQLFERLDRDNDGKLMPADFDYTDPNPATMFMNIGAMKDRMSNQLFGRLDTDSNGRVTREELDEFFRYGDKEELEFLSPEDFRFAIDDPPLKEHEDKPDANLASAGPSTPAAAFKMFLRGDLGWLTSGLYAADSRWHRQRHAVRLVRKAARGARVRQLHVRPLSIPVWGHRQAVCSVQRPSRLLFSLHS